MKQATKPAVLVIAFLFVVIAFPTLACQAVTGYPQANFSTPTLAAIQVNPTVQITPTEIPARTINNPNNLPLDDILTGVYKKANPGVVAIRVLTQDGSGLGSGFVFDTDGHIITNYHVVQGETDLEVDFASGYKVRGSVIGTDTDSDLAIIKVDAPAEELHPLTLGDSSKIQVGQTVIAIGNPFGFTGTMTVGVISSFGRTLESIRTAPSGQPFSAGDIIQTDAAINPGNSGGPLLDMSGEVIGINRAIQTLNFTTGDTPEPLNSGVGFAIAINIVKRVAPALIKDGKYDYPYLGISSLSDISLIDQEALGLPRSTGAYVTEVTPDSPAEKAGLQAGTTPTDIVNLYAGGDLIIAIDGHEIRLFGDMLSYLMNNTSPGDVIVLTVLRGGNEIQVNLTLGKRP
jgi:S1-C subfamily serine protease